MSLTALARDGAIVICCGSGGVGKTTTAAAIAIEGARLGRRACVVTIDPAKRLADALGLDALTNRPGRIEGTWPGALSALMLDTKSTFDDLVTRYASSPAQADAILGNRLYRNISGALSGTQEYMAMEKLYELQESGEFDLIVVDTPPTRNALDFLDAPRRLTRFLDNRIFRLLVMPTRAYLKAVGFATQTFLRTVSKVVGGEVVNDAVAFFRAFEGMEEGFRQRAARVLALLNDPATRFVIVTSPRADAVAEAEFFARKLGESDIGVDAIVVNRVHPSFAVRDERLAELASTTAAPFAETVYEFNAVAGEERAHISALTASAGDAAVAHVPFLAGDVHDLAGLEQLGDYLFPDDGLRAGAAAG